MLKMFPKTVRTLTEKRLQFHSEIPCFNDILFFGVFFKVFYIVITNLFFSNPCIFTGSCHLPRIVPQKPNYSFWVCCDLLFIEGSVIFVTVS